jgi:hypothetical protein
MLLLKKVGFLLCAIVQNTTLIDGSFTDGGRGMEGIMIFAMVLIYCGG